MERAQSMEREGKREREGQAQGRIITISSLVQGMTGAENVTHRFPVPTVDPTFHHLLLVFHWFWVSVGFWVL